MEFYFASPLLWPVCVWALSPTIPATYVSNYTKLFSYDVVVCLCLISIRATTLKENILKFTCSLSQVCGPPMPLIATFLESSAHTWKSYWLAAKQVLKFILSTSPSVLFLARVTNQGEGTNYVGGLQPKNLKLKQRSVARQEEVCCINLASAMNWVVLLIFGLKILIFLGGNAPRKCIFKTKLAVVNWIFVKHLFHQLERERHEVVKNSSVTAVTSVWVYSLVFHFLCKLFIFIF